MMESLVDLAFSPACEFSPNRASSSSDAALLAGAALSAACAAAGAVQGVAASWGVGFVDGTGLDMKPLNMSSFDVFGPFELGAGSSGVKSNLLCCGSDPNAERRFVFTVPQTPHQYREKMEHT